MNENKVSIKPADYRDIHSLTDLMNALGYKTNVQEMGERFSNILRQPNYTTLIAFSDGIQAGMIGASHHYFYEQNGLYVRIVALVTLPHCRRMGVGQALLQAVESWARELGATSILVNCGNREERKGAHEFYRKRGFDAKSTGYLKKL